MSVTKLADMSEQLVSTLLGWGKWFFIIFVIDGVATLLFKAILQGKVITVSDFLIPGLLSGVIYRLLQMAQSVIYFFLFLLSGMLPQLNLGYDFNDALDSLADVFLGFVRLFFVDIVGFLTEYFTSYSLGTIWEERIINGMLLWIQNQTGVPVYDFYMGLIEPVIKYVETIVEVIIEVPSIPTTIASMIAYFLIGTVSYRIVDTCYGAFQDYSSKLTGFGLKQRDFIKIAVYSRDSEGMHNTIKHVPSFQSDEAKARWIEYWAGTRTVKGQKMSYNEQGDPTGYVTVEQPILTEPEKDSILSKIPTGYPFLRKFGKKD